MNQSSKHVSSDGETPQSVDRSLLEFLKPKSEERYSKLEAYCDLLSRASAGAYATPEAEGALQLLPGQFVATIKINAGFHQSIDYSSSKHAAHCATFHY